MTRDICITFLYPILSEKLPINGALSPSRLRTPTIPPIETAEIPTPEAIIVRKGLNNWLLVSTNNLTIIPKDSR